MNLSPLTHFMQSGGDASMVRNDRFSGLLQVTSWLQVAFLGRLQTGYQQAGGHERAASGRFGILRLHSMAQMAHAIQKLGQ
jgi:hypothetical protein